MYIKPNVMKRAMVFLLKRSAAILYFGSKLQSEDYKCWTYYINIYMEVHVNLRWSIVVMRMLTLRNINQTVERGGAEGIIGSTWKTLRASVFDELREQNLDLLWPRGASLYCETTDSTDRVVFLLQIIIEQDHKRSLSKSVYVSFIWLQLPPFWSV